MKSELNFLPLVVVEALSKVNPELKFAENRDIESLLNDSVLFAGKKIRPMLLLLVANAFKIDLDDMIPYAVSVEQIHSASLAHDDVIDNATTRRNRPSINIIGSNKKAVLAGDYLLSTVIETLADLSLDVLKDSASVIKDLSKGEWLQLFNIDNQVYDNKSLLEVASFKTGSLMSLAASIPLTHMSKFEEATAMKEFGRMLGIAFQMVDDSLDFRSTAKDPLQDQKNMQVNFVMAKLIELDHTVNLSSDMINHPKILEAITLVQEDARELISKCHEILKSLEIDDESLRKLLELIAFRKH